MIEKVITKNDCTNIISQPKIHPIANLPQLIPHHMPLSYVKKKKGELYIELQFTYV